MPLLRLCRWCPGRRRRPGWRRRAGEVGRTGVSVGDFAGHSFHRRHNLNPEELAWMGAADQWAGGGPSMGSPVDREAISWQERQAAGIDAAAEGDIRRILFPSLH